MIEYWDQLPSWLQQVIAIAGWVLAILGRLWSRLPKQFWLFDRIYVSRKKGEERLIAWGKNVFYSGPDSRSEVDRGGNDAPDSMPARDPTHCQDQQPHQPDKRQEQQASDRGTDDPPDKAA